MKQEYLTYNAEELAQEAEFIRWVRHAEVSLSESWEQWISEHPGQAEKIAEARTLVQAVDWSLPALSADEKSSMWEAIDAATHDGAKTIQLPGRRRWLWSAAAAVILLLVAGWWWQETPEPTALHANRMESKTFTLPDGSNVSLNAVTQLEYSTTPWTKKRQVKLNGEAFFDVEKGRPFIVETPYGTVEVLGTSFNVEAREEIFRVKCYTGKVRVRLPNGTEKIITPKQGVEAVDGQLEKRTFDNNNDIAWQQRIHYFEEQPLKEVFAELERQYPIDITYPAEVAGILYTGSFMNRELRNSIKSVCWPMGLRFSINQDQVLIQNN